MRSYLTRLNSDGSLDTSFNPNGTGANSGLDSIAIQSDGKILIGGYLTSYNGWVRSYLTRLNSDGTLDFSFNAGGSGANYSVRNLLVQPDGKILVAGSFTSYNGAARSYLARLNADGSLDSSFNVGGTGPGGADGTVYGLAVQSDKKVIIGGSFTSYNGTASNRLARLNADGSLDAFFVVGAGANKIVQSIAVQNDGKILIGGEFTSVGIYTRDYLARLKATLGISLNSSSNPATLGSSITFTTSLSPASASGLITFTFASNNNDNGNGGGSGLTSITRPIVNGVATYVTNTLPVGTYSVTATYSGDSNFLPGSSVVYTQTVTKVATSVALSSSTNPEQFGRVVTLTAAVSAVAPATGIPTSGVVTFTEGTIVLGVAQVDANGLATLTLSNLVAGNHTLTAQYGGNASYLASLPSSPLIQVIKAAKIKP